MFGGVAKPGWRQSHCAPLAHAPKGHTMSSRGFQPTVARAILPFQDPEGVHYLGDRYYTETGVGLHAYRSVAVHGELIGERTAFFQAILWAWEDIEP